MSCKSSAWCNELTFLKAGIQKKLNESVGRKVITDIRFSARGYRRAAKDGRKEEWNTRAKGLESVELDKAEKEAAFKAASVSPSKELADRIEKAILTSKRMAKLKRAEGWRECPKCSELHKGEQDICDYCR